ncbi:hypothetical protein LQW54_007594 [Pestalotiopsis sp. IQ-011]
MGSDNRGPELLGLIWIFTTVSIATVALKLFTRRRFLQGLGWDDFFIFLSLILIITCTAIFTYDVQVGMANPFGIMAYSFPNISVAILLERLLAPNKLRTRLLYLLASTQVVIASISCILLFVQCIPPVHLWNPTIPAKCFPTGTVSRYSYFVGSFTAFTDIVLGIVPIAAFWGLKLPARTKVGLCILMGGTLFAAVCSIVKTTKLSTLSDFSDFTYNSTSLIIWAVVVHMSSVEANVIIIAACLPTLRPFFHNAFNKEKDTTREGSGFFHSLFRNSAGVGSRRSAATPQRASFLPTPVPLPVQAAQAPREGSVDSQLEIWRTTNIQQDTTSVHDKTHGDAV